jgi:hypothetical protein
MDERTVKLILSTLESVKGALDSIERAIKSAKEKDEFKPGDRVQIVGTVIEAKKIELPATGEQKTEVIIKADSGENVVVWAESLEKMKKPSVEE